LNSNPSAAKKGKKKRVARHTILLVAPFSTPAKEIPEETTKKVQSTK
jgi:hypothetical protein